MFWLLVNVGWILLAMVALDWRRGKELLPAALVGGLYATAHSSISASQPWFTLVGSSPVSDHWVILLLNQLTSMPAMAALYAQGLRPGKHPPLRRTLVFVSVYFGGVLVAWRLGKIVVAPWWHPVYATVDGALFFLLVWKVHQYFRACGSPRRVQGDRSVGPR